MSFSAIICEIMLGNLVTLIHTQNATSNNTFRMPFGYGKYLPAFLYIIVGAQIKVKMNYTETT